jgi:hypothetical protein
MRSVWIALSVAGLVAAPAAGLINVKLTADTTALQPGDTTTIRILAQGTSAGIYSLAGNIIAGGTPATLVANAGSFAWVPAFFKAGFPASVLGTPGSNGGWTAFGSLQANYLSPDTNYGKADYVELASYTVTAQPGNGLVVLSFEGGRVGGHKPLECDLGTAIGTLTPVSIGVGSALTVSPTGGLTSSGDTGGPFSPASTAYTLSNPGTAATTWSASKAQAWVSLSKTGGTLAAGESDTVTVSINASASGLAPGSYGDTVSFTNTTSGAGDTTRPVSLTVTSPGQLSVSPSTALSSSGDTGGPFDPASISYTLHNSGEAAITWTAGKTQDWVSLAKTNGTLAGGASDTVIVSIGAGANGLGAGSYSDTVTFTNTTNGTGNTTRAVSLTITLPSVPAGRLTVLPVDDLSSSGNIGGPFNPATMTYTLDNPGDAAITWSAGKTQPWVGLSKSFGSLDAGATDTVTVSITTIANGLATGNYSDTVTFANTTNAIGNTTRKVNLAVTSPGKLVVTPAAGLSSSGNSGGPFSPAGVTYTLSNPGGTPINWTAGKTRTWVTLSKAAGTLNGGDSDAVAVSINANAATLPAGSYSDTVTNGQATAGRTVSLTVLLPGDVDNDGEVSILDVLRFAWAYGTSQGQPGFDPACDFDRDGTITLSDLVVLVENFGKKVAGSP